MAHGNLDTYRGDDTPLTSAVAITGIIATWLVGLVAMFQGWCSGTARQERMT